MARRSKNEGSVFRMQSGRWVAVLELPPGADGRRKRRRRMAPTKTAALHYLREMKAEFESKGSLSDSRRSLADAIDSFRMVQRGVEREASTKHRDEWIFNLIAEALGSCRCASLTVQDCDSFLDAIATGGLVRPDGTNRRPIVRSEVSRVRSMLRKILKNEVRLSHLNRNVADLAEMPATPAVGRQPRALERAELIALLTDGAGALGVFIDLCGRNGLRPQEARAVRWIDLDLDQKTLDVGPQMNRGGERTKPKTKKADRTIAIDDKTIDRLNHWRDEQSMMRTKLGTEWPSPELIVTTSVGTPISSSNMRREMTALCKETRVQRIAPYDLRHTAITYQCDLGYSSWQIADWAGTSERMINEVYRHRLKGVIAVKPFDPDGPW